MESEKASLEAGKPRRWMRLASVITFLVGLGLLNGLLYRNRQFVLEEAAKPKPSRHEAPKVSSADWKARLARAKFLRERWRPWALQHQQQLRQMLNAKKEDRDILMTVWDAIPSGSKPNDGSISAKDLATSKPSWTWQPYVKALKPVSSYPPEQQKEAARSRNFTAGFLRKNFETKRDVVISECLNTGPRISLWASGRVTKTSWVDLPRIPGKPITGPGEPEEILPPYEFLK